MIVPLNYTGMSATGEKSVRCHTRVGMVFYPQSDPIRDSSTGGNGIKRGSGLSKRIIWDAKRTEGTLRSLSWQKAGGQPSGRWSATVKDTSPYKLDISGGDILPDDWVDIYIVRNGYPIPLCRGIVDTVTERKESISGATVRTWELTGRDHGAPMEFPVAYTNMWARKIEEVASGFLTQRVDGSIGGDPATMFKKVLKAALTGSGTTSPWELPGSLTAAVQAAGGGLALGVLDMLTFKTDSPTRGGYFNEPMLWTQAGQSIFEMLNQWCNPLLNEMFFDVEHGTAQAGQLMPFKQTAVIRERPFVISTRALEFLAASGPGEIKSGANSPWFQLPLWKIPHWLVTSSSLSRSNTERFNLFQLLADVGFGGVESEQIAQAPPSWLKDSVRKHGLRYFQRNTNYVAGAALGGQGTGKWVQERKDWQRLLVDWYCLNPYFLSGSVSVPVPLPEIRFGDRIRVETGTASEDLTCYVEAVGFNYQASESANQPPRCSSNFTLSRGWKGTDSSLLDAVLTMGGKHEVAL